MSADGSTSSPSSSDADRQTLSTKTTFSPDATPTRPHGERGGPSSQTLKRPRSPELFGEDAMTVEEEEQEEPVRDDDSGHASSSLSDQSSLSPSPPPSSIRTATNFASEYRRNGGRSRRSSKESEDRSATGERENGETSVLGETASESETDSEEEGDDDERQPSGSTTPTQAGRGRRGVRGGRGGRGRGRPRGKRTLATRQGPPRASPVSAPKAKQVVADPSAPAPRATRATVTLPPGYIEGVKSTRMSRKRSESETPTPSPAPPAAVEQADEADGEEDEESDVKEEEKVEVEEVEQEVEVEVKPKKTPKGKEKERDSPAEPERTLSKRRRVDEGALERAAIRAEQTRVLLEQLDKEAESIRSFDHPLIAATYEKLTTEKALKLRQLAECMDQRELQYARELRANTEITWRRWANAKEALREELYFQNHDSLKQLIAEEKAYPYLRDHPLLVNTHDLPLVPYYRAPLTADLAMIYPPRNPSYTWPSLEPQPLNHAYDHSTWELSSDDVASDMALLSELSKTGPTPVPPPPPMPYPYPAYDNLAHPVGNAYSLAPPYVHPGQPHIPYYPGGAPPHWPGHYEQPPAPPPPRNRDFPASKPSQPSAPPPRTNFDNAPPRTNFDSVSSRQPSSSHNSRPPPPNPSHHAPPTYTSGYAPPVHHGTATAGQRARNVSGPGAGAAKPSSHAPEQQRQPALPAWQKTPWYQPTATPAKPPLPPVGVNRHNPYRPGQW